MWGFLSFNHFVSLCNIFFKALPLMFEAKTS